MIPLDFLLTDYRQRVLGLLLLHPENSFHVREIARLTHTTAGSLHKELANLAKAQVLIREVSGNQVHYRANIHYLIFQELASILRKTSGLIDVLTTALKPVADKITTAFVFGSIASGAAHSSSDVDVLIIGEISFTEAVSAFYSAQTIIGREINPKVYQKSEWNKLIENNNSFIKEILQKPKLFILGTINDLK